MGLVFSLQAGSLGAQLQAHSLQGHAPLNLQLPVSRRVPLEGAELVAYQEQKRKEEMGALQKTPSKPSDAALAEALPTRWAEPGYTVLEGSAYMLGSCFFVVFCSLETPMKAGSLFCCLWGITTQNPRSCMSFSSVLCILLLANQPVPSTRGSYKTGQNQILHRLP